VFLVGPDVLSSAAHAPSIRDWIRLVLWVGLSIALARTTYIAWRDYRQRPDQPARPVPKDSVAQRDVVSAIARSADRMESIEKLRMQYRGLAFNDARELVDRHS
jgi:hypothetical protein